ncbi:transposable element Tcb2 transposase [Trichonephila clavipes]|uniref:Transposable element Tcb2 transposase n=1 Tax=Trichonephila clavipes TaxID=2585209 RepID=A0A8X6V234_TRICX|nr:transposable element Tcb2 transposase [Trichonephila clavipes]
MPLRRFRRQYEHPSSQFERGRIIGIMEAGWSSRGLRCSDCVVRRYWDQWIREMSFTRRPGLGRPRQTSRREDRHIVRNARVQPNASSAAIQAQAASSLGAPVSSRTILRRLAEGHLGSRYPLRVLPLTPTHRCLRLEWCSARGNWTALEWNLIVFSNESRFNLSSDDNRVHVWRPRGEHLNPAFALQQHTSPTDSVIAWGAIAYNTQSSLVLIRGTMTAQRYVHDIRQGCHKPVSAQLLPFFDLPYPQICIQSSVSLIIWDGELGIP